MDSTLGKILASIVGLLALVGVVVAGIVGFSHAKTNAAVADVATLATRIHGDYVNNPAGYATLTNAVAIAAGDVPADMLQGSSVVNAWGSSVSIGPVAGNPKDFAIDLGAVPQAACVQLLTTDGNLMGASVGGQQVSLPITPAQASAACASAASGGLVPMVTQYGQTKIALVPAAPATVSVQYLVVGGGGGGGYNWGGGGGAGGVFGGTLAATPGTSYSITVGQGGVGSASVSTNGANGQNSSFGSVVAFGGGGAGENTGFSTSSAGNSGASGGGGGSSPSTSSPGGSGTSGQGYAGGNGILVSGYAPAGGGGGAGGPGSSTSGLNSGQGGPGVSSSITGTAQYYGGGGGGGGQGSTAAAGGLGGGGAGSGGGTGANGLPGTGGGGGGGSTNGGLGGSGGSGVVILAVPSTDTSVQATGSYTESVVGSNNVFTFTGAGSITF